MATSVAGIQVGVGHILVQPQLHPQFGSNLQGLLGRQMGQAGRAGGANLISGISASANAGPVRARFGLVGRNLAAAVLGGFAAAGIAKGIAKVVSTGIDETKDYAAGLARLNAGLKSTGNQAGLSSTQMEDLASQIQNYSGQTDDSIVSTEQLLLTFTNIKNVAGQGNDVFSQTTKIAADMSARLGGDASASAIQLGKALNDPVKGVTALQRVGVSFDAGQKATIKTLVESGNTLGAQKIILAELNKEFGGSAKAVGQTLPGQLARGKRSFEDLSQTIVTAALPAFNAVVPIVTKAFGKVGSLVQSGIAGGKRAWDDFLGGFQNPSAKIGPGVTGMTRVFLVAGSITHRIFAGIKAAAVPILHAVAGAFRDVGTFVTRDVIPSLRNLWAFLSPVLIPALRIIGTLLIGTVVVGFKALGRILVDVIGPVLRAVTGFLVKHQTAVKAVAIFIATLLVPALTLMAARFLYTKLIMLGVNVALLVVNGALRAMAVVQAVVNAVMNANPFVRIATLIIALGAALFYAYNHSKTFRDIVQAVFRAVAAAGQWMWNNVLKPVFDALKFAWQLTMKAIKLYWDNYAHPVIQAFATAGTWLWNTILKPTFGAITSAWHDLGQALSWVYHTIVEPIWTAIHVALGGISEAFTWVKNTVKTIWDGIVEVFKAPINITLGVVNTFDRVVNDITGAIGLGRHLPEHLHLATGGPVPGGYGGGDTVPIMGEPGEVMLRKETVRRMGGPKAVHQAYNRTAHGGPGGITPFDYGTAQHGHYGSLNPLAGALDAGKWVLSEAGHLLRAGAAAALSAAVAPVRAALNPLGKSGIGGWVHATADHVFDQVIGFIRGKEGGDLTGSLDPGQWKGGRLAWPVPGFYGISQYFGSHPGIDIPAPWGTPIVAANDGLVVSSGPAQGFGNWIRILGQGLGTVYGHMRADELIAHVGEVVKAGQLIAGVGSEGHSTGAHLHFEVHVGGFGAGPSDPVPYLRGGVPATVHDKGGWLRPGYAGLNLSGRPEAVLDPEESLALKAVLSGSSGGGQRPGLFAGANVTIGDRVDLDAAAARHDWEQRRGLAR